MRNGTILSYNKVIGVGVIRDSNQQHILFYYGITSVIPVRGSAVRFEIQLQNGALVAVNLKFSSVRVVSDNIMLSE